MLLNAVSDKLISQFDKHQKSAFKKYLPKSEMDLQWGFSIHDIGYTIIPKESDYPSKGHPGSHMFSWDKGRILNEFHFVIITEGEGVFESTTVGTKKIGPGDGFILFPGEWHRYKPLRAKGWTEYWMGFSGHIPDHLNSTGFFNKEQAIIRQCSGILVMNLFKSLFLLLTEEPFGFQRTASGICLQLLAEVSNIQKASEVSIHANSILSKSKYLMHQQLKGNVDFHEFCSNNRISYSKFRSDFKLQTSFAPLQYFMLMKIEKAKDLLTSTNMRVKQIAFDLGFKSDHYFCRIFKQKTGYSPQKFRTMEW